LGDFVKLDPAAIEELVGICNEIITELEVAREKTRYLAEPKGFGDFESARQLAAGFGRKAVGHPAAAYERFGQFIEAYSQLRDAIKGGGEAFLGEEFEFVRRLRSAEGDR